MNVKLFSELDPNLENKGKETSAEKQAYTWWAGMQKNQKNRSWTGQNQTEQMTWQMQFNSFFICTAPKCNKHYLKALLNIIKYPNNSNNPHFVIEE